MWILYARSAAGQMAISPLVDPLIANGLSDTICLTHIKPLRPVVFGSVALVRVGGQMRFGWRPFPAVCDAGADFAFSWV